MRAIAMTLSQGRYEVHISPSRGFHSWAGVQTASAVIFSVSAQGVRATRDGGSIMRVNSRDRGYCILPPMKEHNATFGLIQQRPAGQVRFPVAYVTVARALAIFAAMAHAAPGQVA